MEVHRRRQGADCRCGGGLPFVIIADTRGTSLCFFADKEIPEGFWRVWRSFEADAGVADTLCIKFQA